MSTKSIAWLKFIFSVLVGALAATVGLIDAGGAEWIDIARPGIVFGMMLGAGNAALSFFSRSGEQIRK